MAKRRSLETPELPILCWRSSKEPSPKVNTIIIITIIVTITVTINIITFAISKKKAGGIMLFELRCRCWGERANLNVKSWSCQISVCWFPSVIFKISLKWSWERWLVESTSGGWWWWRLVDGWEKILERIIKSGIIILTRRENRLKLLSFTKAKVKRKIVAA